MQFSRRTFLKGSLTFAGLGAVGCPRSAGPTVQLTGQRKDPNYLAGHRFRDGDFPQQPTRKIRTEGLILGGGIAGLSAGWRWSRADFSDYKLLELESEVGGNSRALAYPPTPAPIAAHYLPLPNVEAKAVRRLLGEMKVLDPDGSLKTEFLCHSRQERIFYQGRWYNGLIPNEGLGSESLGQIAAFQAHIEEWRRKRDSSGRKIFALPLQYSSQESEFLALDKISFSEYADIQDWTDPFLRWLLEYACRDDFGASSNLVSAWAGLHYFASRDGGGLGDPDDVLVWPEGNNRLARFLKQEQIGEVVSNSLVVKLQVLPGGVEVDYLDLKSQELIRVKASSVVCCLPTFVRDKLLGDGASATFQYHPWSTANLLLDRAPQDLEHPGHIAWDNVIHGSPSLGYVVATHQNLTADPVQPTVWTWYRPFPSGEPKELRGKLLDARWETWSEEILSELELVHSDIRARCQQLDVTILGHGMIKPSVDFIWSEPMKAARASQGRLHFGHGDLSGMSLFEESQFRGVLAAEKALAQLGISFNSFI